MTERTLYAQDGELDILDGVTLHDSEEIDLPLLLKPYVGERIRLRVTVEPLPPHNPIGVRT